MSTRVLVADDSNTMRKIIIRNLQAVGISLGGRGLGWKRSRANLHSGPFRPGADRLEHAGQSGLEVIKEIRAKDAKVPIIMITTEAEKGRVLQAIQAGVTDYLVKPFTPDTLREKLEKHGCG